MLRMLVFRDLAGNIELVLPVTPPSYKVSYGVRFETINIHERGDVAIAGYPTLATIKIDCMFPAQDRPFNNPGTVLTPNTYIEAFKYWCFSRTALRYIVTGTDVNLPVKVESIEAGERDGTNDVYASITLRETRTLAVVQAEYTDAAGNKTRGAAETSANVQSYTVRAGDTIQYICRKFYGDTTLFKALADYNNIKNPYLLEVGRTVYIPPKSVL